MPRVAMLDTEETNGQLESNGSNGESGETGKKRGSPYMYSLLPQMVSDPYPLDFADGMDSYDFATEKCRRLIVSPLKFKSQKEWLDFAKSTWAWVESASDREAKVQADQLVQRIQELIAETQENPKLNQLIKEKLAAVVEAD